MVRSFRKTYWNGRGKIIGLAKLIDHHKESIEYDLFCRTGYSLEDLGTSISWNTLYDFITHLDDKSAFARDVSPEAADWGSVRRTNIILADIFDMLGAINYNLIRMSGSKSNNKPKLYPRPGQNNSDSTKKFGKKPLPVTDIRNWVKSYVPKNKL